MATAAGLLTLRQRDSGNPNLAARRVDLRSTNQTAESEILLIVLREKTHPWAQFHDRALAKTVKQL